MDILFLCTYYHRAMIFRDSMNALEALGHNTLAFNAVAHGAAIDDKYLPIMDAKVVHEECFNTYDRYIYHYKQYKIYKTLIRKINVDSFDVIHSHSLMNGGWVAKRIKNKKNIPYVVTVRNTDLNAFLRFSIFIPVARAIADEANAIMFLSTPYKRAFLRKVCKTPQDAKELDKKCYIIPNGLENFWLEHIVRGKKLNKGLIRLICVGKIDHNKNMKSVLTAMDLLKNNGIGTKLTVIGQIVDGDVFKILRANENVEIISYQTKEKLIDYYRKSDIFVMPSYTESFGRVYAEAMTQGLPIIYTHGQGFDGFFAEGEVGYSVDAYNPSTVTDAIIKIIQNHKRISLNCINNCRKFDWVVIADDLERMYKEAIGRN